MTTNYEKSSSHYVTDIFFKCESSSAHQLMFQDDQVVNNQDHNETYIIMMVCILITVACLACYVIRYRMQLKRKEYYKFTNEISEIENENIPIINKKN